MTDKQLIAELYRVIYRVHMERVARGGFDKEGLYVSPRSIA